jgi:predicted RNase H-like nuclease (RuvC/YqgF family)
LFIATPKDKRDNTISVLRAENRRMKRQIETLKRYITHAESMAAVVALCEGKVVQTKTFVTETKTFKCQYCKGGEVKTCRMHQRAYHRCQSCQKMWSIATSATLTE